VTRWEIDRGVRGLSAAFLPTFLDASAPVAPQLLVMGATFLLILLAVCIVYARTAARSRRFFEDRQRSRVASRTAGAILIGTGLALAASGSERPS
jgi:threonine/homoserine/homoserine lactone efflux protein